MSDDYVRFVYEGSKPDRYYTVELMKQMMRSQEQVELPHYLIRAELGHEKVGCTFVSDLIYKFLGDNPQKVKFVDGKDLRLKALLMRCTV
jgi:hypothetical protein